MVHEFPYQNVVIQYYSWALVSLGSRPPPFRVRLNYAHAYAANIRRTGKAWAETSREGRRGVDAWRCGT